MNKERILITGGSGFVGTNFISNLSTDKYEIFSLDSSDLSSSLVDRKAR